MGDDLFSVRNALVHLEIRHVDVFELLDVLVRDGQVYLGDRRIVDYPGVKTLVSQNSHSDKWFSMVYLQTLTQVV